MVLLPNNTEQFQTNLDPINMVGIVYQINLDPDNVLAPSTQQTIIGTDNNPNARLYVYNQK